MNTLWQDLRFGFRMLRKSPVFTTVAVIALALGIGANTAIFSVVNAVLLSPLPFGNPDRLVMIWENDTQEGNPRNQVAPANYIDFRERNRTFEQLAFLTQTAGVNLTGGDQPERIESSAVSANFFSLLKVQPVLGPGFRPEDEKPDAEPVVVLSYGLWQRRFGGDTNIIGKTLTIEGQSASVVGVAPRGFQFPEKAEMWGPMPLAGEDAKVRARHSLLVIGRLKPDATLAEAKADLSTIASQLATEYPETNTGRGATLLTIKDQLVGDVQPALIILLGAVGFVLLIACANVANLSLARGAARQKELAVRLTLGATRGRLVRQLLTESVLLSLMGGVLGLLLAVWGIDFLLALGPTKVPRIEGVRLNWMVLGFTMSLSVLTGIIFGLVPALQASKPDLNESLKETERGASGGVGRVRARGLLVISEVALALVLLIGAGLLIKSFVRLQRVELGFNPENVLTMQLSLPFANYKEPNQVTAFYTQLTERVRHLPGVQAVGIVSRLPLAGDRSTSSLAIEGRPVETGKSPEAHFRIITPDYFRAMGMVLRDGREFTADDRADAPPVVIINETVARTFWPGEQALGKRVKLGPNPNSPWVTVVGVVNDARNFGLDAEAKSEVYVSYLQNPPNRVRLVVRTGPDPTSVLAAIKREIQMMDKDLPVAQVRTMEQLLGEAVAQRRLNMVLLAVFSSVALLLAAVGLYGVMAYSVTQRTHEIGVRMALGAQSADVMRLIVGQGMVLTLIGVGTGIVGAFLLTRVMSGLLYGVSATDPVIFGSIALLLTAVAFLACYLPARRASKVDPMVALRYE
jgi:putative ABC transport system permease protein